MAGRFTFVAESNDEVVGFAELEINETTGHLEMLYRRADAGGRGVGSLLYVQVESEARRLVLDSITTEASITARPFSRGRGSRYSRSRASNCVA